MILGATDVSWLDLDFRRERLLDLDTNISMSLETDSLVIFRKEKKCWSEFVKQDKYVNLFADLGIKKYLDESTLKGIEMYVCSLYGYPRLDSGNDVRKAIFWKYFE